MPECPHGGHGEHCACPCTVEKIEAQRDKARRRVKLLETHLAQLCAAVDRIPLGSASVAFAATTSTNARVACR